MKLRRNAAMSNLRSLIALMSLVVVSGCAGSPPALAPCDPQSTDRPICNLTNPEDLGFLSGREWVIVSEMAPGERDEDEGEEDAPPLHGRLTVIRLLDLELHSLYPGISEPEKSESIEQLEATPGWGDADCPGGPDPMIFKPHGIDVGQGPFGRPALAVVNHGGREAVEFFEIESGAVPSLTWRGCVLMPDEVMANDVALLPGGGFVVTNFMPRFESVGPGAIWSVLEISMGVHTGSVLKWEPGGVIREIENSQGSAPNGVEVSADGMTIYVAEWGAGKVYRLRLDGDGPPRRDEVSVDHNPDNLTWTRDGRLLVAGQHGGVMTSLGCDSIREGGCDLGYSVYLLEPDGLEVTRIFEGRGAVSVALEVDDEYFVGSFVGDQIMRVPRPD
jgi:hypothetical protein